MKYSYILPIRNRADLLRRGLQSYDCMDYDKDNFEVVIADYMSEDNIKGVINEFRGRLNIKYLCIDPRRYVYHKVGFHKGNCNPALAQNVAVIEADGEFIIMTSPEILQWKGNLKNLDMVEGLKDKFLYGKVIEKSEKEFFNTVNHFDIMNTMDSPQVLCDWEKVLKSVTLYFIGVMAKSKFIKYGGIDEQYMCAIAYDDEDFGKRMEKCPDLELVFDKNVFGIHLTHDRSYQEFSNIEQNMRYLNSKEKDGIQNHLVANKNIKLGDPEVLIERSQMWRY